MNAATIAMWAMPGVTAAGVGACLVAARPARLLWIPAFTGLGLATLGVVLAIHYAAVGAFDLAGGQLRVDALTVFHVLLVNLVFLAAAVYAPGYFQAVVRSGAMNLNACRRYAMLWQAFQLVLLAVLLANNIGLMWVALEATTLVSAFLILSRRDPLSIEAMWKYLLICSVGIVFAFIGTILTVAAASQVGLGTRVVLLDELQRNAAAIGPSLMLPAFIFVLVGYGTKAGLAPLHTWLPDAHSQAPTPVSAVFSGVMLNCALYCIMRYLPIAEAALGGHGRAHGLLLFFGVVSLLFAAVFIPGQYDIKRLLAYCSVEHVGIIAIGLGLGGVGVFAALWHTLNHSLAKVWAFFAAGALHHAYGTRDMRRMAGALNAVPPWGAGFLVTMLALLGVAPFALFMSELQILRAAFAAGRYGVVAIFLLAVLVIFIGALRSTLQVVCGARPADRPPPAARWLDRVMMFAGVAALLVLGVWIPGPLAALFKAAASVVEGGLP